MVIMRINEIKFMSIITIQVGQCLLPVCSTEDKIWITNVANPCILFLISMIRVQHKLRIPKRVQSSIFLAEYQVYNDDKFRTN